MNDFLSDIEQYNTKRPLTSSLYTDDFSFYPYKEGGTLIVFESPELRADSPKRKISRRSLEEHIEYIQENQIKQAIVIANHLDFLRRCPSLEHISIYPSYTAQNFDYSPLYDLPNLRSLECHTKYGFPPNKVTTVDYSRLPNLEGLDLEEQGHLNVSGVEALKVLSIGPRFFKKNDLRGTFQFSHLISLILCQTRLVSLDGIEDAANLKRLTLVYNSKMQNISALESVKDSLVWLEIDACGGIKDYSVLQRLHCLEYLELGESAVLPNLSFVNNMPNLKHFVFRGKALDGDISVLDKVPNVLLIDRRHYNHKRAEYHYIPPFDRQMFRHI